MARPDRPARLEHWVHRSLLAGLAVSAALMVLGLALALARGGPRSTAPRPLFDTMRGALRGEGVDLIDLGLLALIATPALRVTVLAVGWAAQGNRRFAAVALTVLGLLGLSLALGLG
jgi:uncharacterized membrane protein